MKYIKMPIAMLMDSRLSINDMRVLAVLVFRSNPNPDNICWPSIKDIAYQTGIAEKKISGHTKRLVKFGWIEKKTSGKGGIKNYQIYEVITPPDSGVVKPPPNRYPNPPQTGTLTPPKLGGNTPIIEIIKGNNKMKLGNPCENSFDLKRRKMSDEDTKKQRALLAKLLRMENNQKQEFANA